MHHLSSSLRKLEAESHLLSALSRAVTNNLNLPHILSLLIQGKLNNKQVAFHGVALWLITNDVYTCVGVADGIRRLGMSIVGVTSLKGGLLDRRSIIFEDCF